MSDGKSREATLRGLPSVDQLMRHPDIQGLRGGLSSEVLTRIIRDALAEVRSAVLAGAYRDIPAGELRESLTGWVVTGVLARSEGFSDIGPHAVINATGVVLHTNLGRAPLSDAARQAVATSGAGYSDLEYRLDSGARGSRHDHLAKLFRDVLGTTASTPETLDAIAVNNCAGALLLTLAELARGREVIVSRGHLVEIGGGFRVPDVMRQSGATLVEVGTTNRTRLSDYANAITPATAAILKVHPGNFRIVGFTEDVATSDLASLARKHGVPMIEDIGSGCLLDITDFGVPQALREPRPQESLAAGASIVMFSGDKLLGGPQAGIIAGEPALIARIRHHPLARALRLDKLGVAALAATLGHYRRGDALRTVPVWQMIGATSAVLATRATAIASKVGMGGSEVRVIAGVSAIGGGSLPGVTLPTSLVAVTPLKISAEELATRLRHHHPNPKAPDVHALRYHPNPMAPDVHALRSRTSSSVPVDPEASRLQDAVTIPVVARIEHDTVLFDPRTVMPDEDDALVRMIRRANLPR